MNALTQSLTIRDSERRDANIDFDGATAFSEQADLERLSTEFVTAADQFGKSGDQLLLQRLQTLRLQIVEALLAQKPLVVPTLAPSLNAVAVTCIRSGMRSYPRRPREDDLFGRCQQAVDCATPGEDVMPWFAAMFMAWHAFELPHLPPLTAIPHEVRGSWLSFLFETPPAFAHNGDGERFPHYLQRVCDLLLQHLRATVGPAEDVATAFFSNAAFVQSYFNELNLRDLMVTRGAIIEDILTRRGSTLDQLRMIRPCKPRPRIGFIVLSASDGTETTALAANLERLDRRRFEVRLYSVYKPAGTMGALCRAAAESYRQLSGSVPAAVAQLRSEDLDIAIFCTNLTASSHVLTQTAAHRVAPVQVANLASAVTTGLRNMDIVISGALNETESASEHYSERLVCTDGALSCFPFHYLLENLSPADPVFRAAHGVPEDAVLFFSAANFYKLMPEVSELWFRILSQVPNSHLMLMPFNPNWASSYPLAAFNARLRTQAVAANVILDRVHIHPSVSTIAQLYRIMEMADIYLDAFPFSGACSVTDALIVGLPIVSDCFPQRERIPVSSEQGHDGSHRSRRLDLFR
jgi:hypothetical protein